SLPPLATPGTINGRIWIITSTRWLQPGRVGPLSFQHYIDQPFLRVVRKETNFPSLLANRFRPVYYRCRKGSFFTNALQIFFLHNRRPVRGLCFVRFG